MPRMPRSESSTGIYHVMLRGIDKRDIFLNICDYEKFFYFVLKAKDKVEFSVYAYCLMPNHVHLLVKTDEAIGNVVRRITVGYAQYHNLKYERTGHLFQNRFRSEPVEDDSYFVTVLRYIHQNPLKAGLTKQLNQYRWSSFREYVNEKFLLVSPEYPLSYFKDIDDFQQFNLQNNSDECLEYIELKRWTDESLEEFINETLDQNILNSLDNRQRVEALARIKKDTGASDRQLSRVLNIDRRNFSKIKL